MDKKKAKRSSFYSRPNDTSRLKRVIGRSFLHDDHRERRNRLSLIVPIVQASLIRKKCRARNDWMYRIQTPQSCLRRAEKISREI